MLVYLLEKCNGAAAESSAGHSGPVDALHLHQMSSSKSLEVCSRTCLLILKGSRAFKYPLYYNYTQPISCVYQEETGSTLHAPHKYTVTVVITSQVASRIGPQLVEERPRP
jgi:hypothetical protein